MLKKIFLRYPKEKFATIFNLFRAAREKNSKPTAGNGE